MTTAINFPVGKKNYQTAHAHVIHFPVPVSVPVAKRTSGNPPL